MDLGSHRQKSFNKRKIHLNLGEIGGKNWGNFDLFLSFGKAVVEKKIQGQTGKKYLIPADVAAWIPASASSITTHFWGKLRKIKEISSKQKVVKLGGEEGTWVHFWEKRLKFGQQKEKYLGKVSASQINLLRPLHQNCGKKRRN